jgi:hypothetical protein
MLSKGTETKILKKEIEKRSQTSVPSFNIIIIASYLVTFFLFTNL